MLAISDVSLGSFPPDHSLVILSSSGSPGDNRTNYLADDSALFRRLLLRSIALRAQSFGLFPEVSFYCGTVIVFRVGVGMAAKVLEQPGCLRNSATLGVVGAL